MLVTDNVTHVKLKIDRQKKAREEKSKKNKGVLLKYLESATQRGVTEHDIETSVTTSEKCAPSTRGCIVNHEALSNETAAISAQSESWEIEMENSEEIDSLQGEDTGDSTATQTKDEYADKSISDIGTWLILIPDNLRTLLVARGYKTVQHLDCKFAEVNRPGSKDSTKRPKGVTRKLNRDWFFRTLPNGEKVLRTWMAYSPSKRSLLCFCCRLFGIVVATKKFGFNTIDGFNQWWKLNPKVSEHESSTAHNENFNTWKCLERTLQAGTTIDKEAQNVIVIDSATGNKGNFLALVHLFAKYDPVLCEHLTKVKLQKKVSVSYLSPEIQNEFINCLGNHVRKKIFAEVKEAKYFTIVFDSTPDLSHKDQTSQILRYVKFDDTKVEVMESFIDFLETEGKKAEDISKMTLDKIESDGLDIRNCRGQAYDNAAVMSGIHSGVQTRIKAINSNAQYVAYSNHTLNLVRVHAASVTVHSVTFFGTMDKVFNYFLSSTHRWKVLTDITGQGVKRLIETRWSARYEAIAIMKSHYTEIIEVLESLLQNIKENAVTRSDAGLLLPALQSLPFLVFLGLWNRVLCEINDTQLYLQTKGLNVHHCAMKIYALQKDKRMNI
ncbi:hypothetical protein RN001_015888 [Aquatica leii]|uniref:DUF4371 domain-containing protein n=1 Tax=Aquatica leii TaxID=1421715 RepID=A0AAN7NXC9_9COLE|nr:hypothetical protein RN001_015888 [Aquatica leii]